MKRPFLLFVILASTCVVNAEPMRQPPDLEPGDQYRLAFVTSTTTNAVSSDIDTYNAFVQATADAAPIGEWGVKWYAIAQTETVTARENSRTTPDDLSVPIYLLDGGRLVDSYDDLWSNSALNAQRNGFALNEFAERHENFGNGFPVWTGTGEDGVSSLFFVPDLGIGPLGSLERSVIGRTDLGPAAWFESTAADLDGSLPLYAISETLTAVPEPASHLLFPISFVLIRSFAPQRDSSHKREHY